MGGAMKSLLAFFCPLFSVIAALHGTALHADSVYPFKRVFTTEAERNTIDKIRLQPTSTEDGRQINVTAAAVAAPTAPKVTFSGVHIGPNGKYLVWVDGKSKLSKTPAASGVKSSTPSKTTGNARIYTGAKSTLLKPGQVWLINSNEIQEGYEIKAPQAKTVTIEAEQKPKGEVPEVIQTLKALKELNAQ